MSTEADNEAEVLTQEVATEAPALAPAEAGTESNEESSPTAQTASVSPDIERKARDMGWVPQNEWHGSPDAWRPAAEFVKRGEEVLPIVRSNLERERRERQRLENEIRELPNRIRADLEQSYADRFKRMEHMNRVALDKQREQMWQQFEDKKRAAVADGNMQAYDALTQQQHRALAEFQPEAQFEEDHPPAKPNGIAQQPPVQVPPAVQEWVSRNTWFNRDKAMSAFAEEEHGRLLREMPGLSIEENLERTLAATRARFPERFGISPQSRPTASAHAPSVEGGGRQAQASAARARGWNDLPPEAKASAEKFIRQDGLFLPKGVDPDAATEADIKKARDAYAKDYWSLS